MINGTSDFMSDSPSTFVTTQPSVVVVDLMEVEKQGFGFFKLLSNEILPKKFIHTFHPLKTNFKNSTNVRKN